MQKDSKIKIDYVKIGDLKPYDRNPRKNDAQVAKVVQSIESYGFKFPILANKKDKQIIDGHLRLKGAIKLGLESLPVIFVDDLTPAEIKGLRLLANRSANWAEWDEELLKLEFEDLKIEGFDLELTGFDFDEIATFLPADMTSHTDGVDADDVPDVQDNTVSTAGEIWQLGEHLVMCGDSSNILDIKKILGNEKADLVFTDPPYLIETKGGCKGNIGKSLIKQGKDIEFIADFDPSAFLENLQGIFDNNKMNAYIFCNKELLPQYLNYAVKNKISYNVLIWKKPAAIPIGDSHRPDIEYLVLYRRNAIWNNGLKNVNYSRCLEFGRERGLHPTMKPVELIANELLISSNKNSLVFDFFGGSGSTLIACEQTGRKCFCIEKLPKYVDVIIRRWQQYTGQTARRQSDGKNFNEIADEK